jgi:hypothetical protein
MNDCKTKWIAGFDLEGKFRVAAFKVYVTPAWYVPIKDLGMPKTFEALCTCGDDRPRCFAHDEMFSTKRQAIEAVITKLDEAVTLGNSDWAFRHQAKQVLDALEPPKVFKWIAGFNVRGEVIAKAFGVHVCCHWFAPQDDRSATYTDLCTDMDGYPKLFDHEAMFDTEGEALLSLAGECEARYQEVRTEFNKAFHNNAAATARLLTHKRNNK